MQGHRKNRCYRFLHNSSNSAFLWVLSSCFALLILFTIFLGPRKIHLTNLLVSLITLSYNHQNHKQWTKWGHVPYNTHACVSGNGSMRGHAGLHCAHKCYNFFSWYYTVQFRHTTHVHSPLWMHERKLHPHLWRLSRQIFEIDKVITCTTTLFEALIRGKWWRWSTGKRKCCCVSKVQVAHRKS